jgi:hypothetical protein
MNAQAPFRNKERARQLVLFDRLVLDCGKQATDIDYSTDKHGRVFVFGDFKFKDAPCPEGQKRHLTSKVMAIWAHTHQGLVMDACAFIARHSFPDGQDIDPNDAHVSEYCWRSPKWKICRQPVPFKMFVDQMIQRMSADIVEPF